MIYLKKIKKLRLKPLKDSVKKKCRIKLFQAECNN